MEIIITGMSLDGHEVAVPHGLSELINNAGLWGIKEKKNEPSILDQYNRRTFRRDGNLVTVLTLKASESKKAE
jgi:hypothetical protein